MSKHRIIVETFMEDLNLWARRPVLDMPILTIEEDGEFYVTWKGERFQKNILLEFLGEEFVSGQFYLVAVPGTIDHRISGGGSLA